MAGRSVTRTEVYKKKNYVMFGDISGMIWHSGNTCGSAAVSLPAPLALQVVSEMMGEEIESGLNDPMIQDGVGELINMIAGGAKTTLSGTKLAIDFTLPTIISGRGHELYHRQGTTTVSTVFKTDRDEQFAVDVSLSDA